MKGDVKTELKANIAILPTGYYFTWEGSDVENVAIGVTRIRDNTRKGSVDVEFEVAVDRKNGLGLKALLTHIRTNLLSGSARSSLVKYIKDNAFVEELRYYPWEAIVHQVANITIRQLRKADPVVMLTSEYQHTPPKYLLYPLLVQGSPTILYAERSSAKSLYALLISIILTLPWHDNPFNLMIKPNDKHRVLYLDWESDDRVIGWQKEQLIKGLGLGFCDIPYMHCARPLSESVDVIREAISKCQADVIIIDSLGMAVGDDLNLTAPAFDFWGAVRLLPATPIIIGHTAKDSMNRRRTVYGNAYYEAEARGVWELAKEQTLDSNELRLSIYHRKPPPFAGLHRPLGFSFMFNEEGTEVKTCEPQLDARTKETTDVSDMDIIDALFEDADTPLMYNDAFELTNKSIKMSSIKVYFKRLKDNNRIEKVAGGYVRKQ